MSNIDKRAFAMTKELATLMVERFSMNPVSCKLLNEAWKKEFPDEVAIAERMLALLDELEAKDRMVAELSKLLADIQKGRPGGVYFNKWDAQISNVLRAAAAGKGEAS